MLDEKAVQVLQERSSRKEPFSEAEVRALLRKVSKVRVARGRKVIELGDRARPADLEGPSGNYRAPMLLKGKTLLVGFNEEAVRDFL